MLFFCLFSCVAFASYPEYQPILEKPARGDGAYLRFIDKVDKTQIKTIFEIGSMDAIDAMNLSYFYKCHVFAFECNPSGIEICRSNIERNPNVTLVPLGVWDTSGPISFYPVDAAIGTSSFFEFNPKARNYPDIVKDGLIQREITVPCTRLDEFLEENDFENIDLLCMDVQGAASQVLHSLGNHLESVKYIIVELETHPIYAGEILYQEVDDFLIQSGFIRGSEPLDPNGLFGDMLYINSLQK